MPAFPAGWTEEKLIQLAHQLHEAHARPSQEGVLTRWFHGPRYSDVFIDIAPGGEVTRLEVSFEGHYFLYTPEVMKTGSTDEMAIEDGSPRSRTVTQDSEIDKAVLNAAATIAKNLPDKFLAEFVDKNIWDLGDVIWDPDERLD